MTAVGLGFLAGGGAGALSAYLGWNRSGEDFNPRKFIDGLATGIIAGIGLAFANITTFKTATDDLAILTLIGTIAFGALGADFIREHVSSIAAKPKPTTPVPAPA